MLNTPYNPLPGNESNNKGKEDKDSKTLTSHSPDLQGNENEETGESGCSCLKGFFNAITCGFAGLCFWGGCCKCPSTATGEEKQDVVINSGTPKIKRDAASFLALKHSSGQSSHSASTISSNSSLGTSVPETLAPAPVTGLNHNQNVSASNTSAFSSNNTDRDGIEAYQSISTLTRLLTEAKRQGPFSSLSSTAQTPTSTSSSVSSSTTPSASSSESKTGGSGNVEDESNTVQSGKNSVSGSMMTPSHVPTDVHNVASSESSSLISDSMRTPSHMPSQVPVVQQVTNTSSSVTSSSTFQI
jgi:hypothetical protein